MTIISLNANFKTLSISNVVVHIHNLPKGSPQKVGLLNHRTLSTSECVLFSKRYLFHTFGMNFPISVAVFDKDKRCIAWSKIITPNKVFICPISSKYIIELHESYAFLSSEHHFKKEIHILSDWYSKLIFYFVKYIPIFLILLASLFAMNNVFALNSLKLNLGNTRTIQLEKPPQTIQIDDPEILDLERVGITNSIKIIPKQVGNTSLTFQYLDGNDETVAIQISSLGDHVQNLIEDSQTKSNQPSPEFEGRLKQIKGVSNIEHSVNAGKIFLFGKIRNIEKFKEIASIVAVYPKAFFPCFEIEPSIISQVLDYLNTDLRSMGNHNLTIIQNNNHILLKGVSASEALKDKTWSYLSAVLPNIVDTTTSFFGEDSLIQINLEFFEVGRGYKKNVGFQYPNLGSNSAGITVSGERLEKPMFQITPFSVFFRALSARNYVREIARPVLMTRSGEKATFLAGGEVPIPSTSVSASSTSTSVTFKSVGIQFEVTPRVNDDGTIWLKLNAEYSQINESISYQKTPGFNSRKISTNIILKEGIAAIISGLIQNMDLKKTESIPALSKLPVLGEFFTSKENMRNSTELWIAVSAIHQRNL